MNYPGMFLKVSSDNKGFYGEFAAYPKDISVEVRGLKGMVKHVNLILLKWKVELYSHGV